MNRNPGLIPAFDNRETTARNLAEANRGASFMTDEMLKRSPDVEAMVDYWDKNDAFIDGIDAVRLAGIKYFPKFPGEKQEKYDYRLSVTKMTNVYGDIVENLASKPFEKESKLVDDDDKAIPEELVEFSENVDGAGNNLTVFLGKTFYNAIGAAIDWIFVDYPKTDKTIRSVADLKASGIRPYWSHVLGRNVLHPRVEMIDGKETLTYIKIFEPGKPDHVRIFERQTDGRITWELYERSDKPVAGRTQFVLIDDGVLSIDQIPLVPFATGRRDGRTFKFDPAMKSALDLQECLFRNESALEYVKILAGYPILTGNGVKPVMQADGKTPIELMTGPGCVLYAPPDGSGKAGNWEYVEPSAQTMEFLAKDNKETVMNLRELGRQPLTAQSGNLTVITTAVAAAKATSAVKAWALLLKDAAENAFVITCKWLNISTDEYDPTVYIFNEWRDGFDDTAVLSSIDADRARGDISQETLWEEKKARGVYSEDFTAEREKQRLLDETPDDVDLEDDDDDTPPRPGDRPGTQPKPKPGTSGSA